ncbi:MAG: long-chain fatty acid--CoA ligase [Candidatus Eremiobacteraeota bacterium]|nr:long-chain fatty acid--CoA ligase [Candidatus Eremiobacteraeota bacterium]
MNRPATLIDLISEALAAPRERVLVERLPGRAWEALSSQRVRERYGAIARALRDAGIARGDRAGIFSQNRIDWLVCDYGILFASAVTVPMYATLADDQVGFIIRDAGMRLLFVETQTQAERIHMLCGDNVRVVTFEGTGNDSLQRFEARGAALIAADPTLLEAPAPEMTASELALLMYTSGTTGEPKGVMLTHGNLASNVVDAFAPIRDDLQQGDVAFSVLPFAHVYEHTDALGFLYLGLKHVVSGPDRLLDDIREALPHVAAFVPRIFELVLTGVLARAREDGGIRAHLVPWALATAREHARALADGRSPPLLASLRYRLAGTLVLRRVKAALGLERISHLVSGSAPLQRDTALTFAGIGIPVCEGYGLTETSPVVSVNRVATVRYGSVGKPLPHVDVRIADDGEILVRGPSVMKGYYRRDDDEPFVDGGWFCTGDIGRLDADGYLWIVDRKNDLFKTAGGKWVSPARLEAAIKRSPYVAQAVVVGAHRPHPAALIVPAWDVLRREYGLTNETTTQEIASRDDVRAKMLAEVMEATAELAPYEHVRRVTLLPRDLTLNDGELSPTLKVKRRIVEARYADLIEAAYTEPAAVRRGPTP